MPISEPITVAREREDKFISQTCLAGLLLKQEVTWTSGNEFTQVQSLEEELGVVPGEAWG